MVRPTHDLPNLLVGGVRDYAEREGIEPEEAHARLLKRSLRDVGILCCESDTDDSDEEDTSSTGNNQETSNQTPTEETETSESEHNTE